MHLTKHHGLGNDFLVLLDEVQTRAPTVDAELARRLCSRHRGIGADGLLHGWQPSPSETAPDVDVAMTLYNSDGSRAEMSGNGIRCFAQAVARARGIDAPGRLHVATDAGLRDLQLEPGADPATLHVAVDMGAAKVGPAVDDELAATLVRHATADLGNPHLVVLTNGVPRGEALVERGRAAETHFADGINVEFIEVTGPDRLELTVWERGAGVTEACGTGACAAAWVAHGWGLVGERVAIAMPGGQADVVLGADDRVTLIGPTVFIADIEVDSPTTGTEGAGA
jgi:diaminopimelate epimerase